MMNLQDQILKDYKEMFGHESFKQISDKTGIQVTRVFRLFNGSPMRLNEYEAFKQLVEFRQIKRPKLFKLLKECEVKLSDRALIEIEGQLNQRMRLWRALNEFNSLNQEQAA